MTQVRIRGLDDIHRKLDRLASTMRADILVSALEDSAEPMRDDYARGASVVSNTIAERTRVRVVEAGAEKATVAVGTKNPLAHIFEFGTRPRFTKGGEGKKFPAGAARGSVKAIGFARRAFDTNVRAWFRGMGENLWREFNRRARR